MRNRFELEAAGRQRAADVALTNINQVLDNRRELQARGTGEAGGGGVINRPAVDPETGDWAAVALLWVPDDDIVGSVPVA